MISWSWYFTFTQTVPWLDSNGRNTYAYLVPASTLGLLNSVLYGILIRHFITDYHPSPPETLPESIAARREPYECIDDAGALATCKKGKCKGSIKPPRSHHCKTCGRCRMGYDHHCPWIGTCIGDANKLVFVIFCLATPLTLLVAFWPIVTPLARQAIQAYEKGTLEAQTSQFSWIQWNPGYWVPPGKQLIAVLLGYWSIHHNQSEQATDMIEKPHFGTFLTFLFAAIFILMCSALAIRSIVDIAHGETTVEVKRREQGFIYRFYFLADEEASAEERGRVIEVDSKERPYDLGWRQNFRALINARKNLAVHRLPQLNPILSRRLNRPSEDD